MLNLIGGGAMVFLFSAFVILILKQRRRYFEYNPLSWKTLLAGGALLVLGGGVNLATVFNPVPSVSSTTLQIMQAFVIFDYVAGGGLILLGFLKLGSSLIEAKTSTTRRLRQLTCLHALLSAINHHQELDEILKESLTDLINIMGYKMGVIFKPTFNSAEMTVAAHGGVPPENLHTLFDLYSKNNWYQESIKSKEATASADVKTLPEYGTLFGELNQIRSFACIPIKFCGKILGLMGLYDSKPDRFSYQELQFLSNVGEILGLSTNQNLAANRNRKRRTYISALENVLSAVQENRILADAFPKIALELKRIMGFDHISLIFTPGWGKDMKRISMGSSGGVLVDRCNRVPQEDSLIGKAMSSREVRIDRHTDTSGNSSDDSLLKACGIKSRIALPLGFGESIYGVLCLGHQEPNFYSTHDGKWLKAFCLTLSHLLLEQMQRDKLSRKDYLTRSLGEFEKRIVMEEDISTLIKDLTADLTTDLPKSFARVSLLNKQGDQLISCAAHQIRSEGIELRRDEKFPLQYLPWHRLTLDAGKPMLINQEDPESFMSRKEARLIMDERVNSAVLVPLILQNRAVGVISVGEMRSWDRQPLTEEEIVFLEHRANQVCVALKKGLLNQSNERLKDKLRRNEIPKEPSNRHKPSYLSLSELSYQINNSLTAIRGSAELLKLTQTNLNSVSLKYLNNIENGVDRIHRDWEEYLNSEKEEVKTRINHPGKEPVAV